MINIDVERGMLSHIEQRLGNLSDKKSDVLKKAVNHTARWARIELAKEAEKAYVVQKGSFHKAMKLKNATDLKPAAIIKTTGKSLELIDFEATPSVYSKEAQLQVAQGKVLKKSKMKTLQKSNLKAFIVKFGNGHETIVQRVEKGKVPSRSKLGNRYMKKLLSPSVPSMIGNEKEVYGKLEPNIQEVLRDHINKQIGRILKK